jgi:hypothetical protein
MADRNLPTPEELHNLLRYEPETGRLYWRERIGDDRQTRRWNTRYAGAEAMTAQQKHGHKFGHVLGIPVKAHRVAWAMHHGQWPDTDIDHINGDAADNRITNLRAATEAQNMQNKRRYKNNKSGCSGVAQRESGTWRAFISVGGKRKDIGTFNDKFDAVLARLLAEKELGFTYRHGVAA